MLKLVVTMLIKYLSVFILVQSVILADEINEFRCDYTYFEGAHGWFKFHRFPMKWFDAKLRCMLEGARLASPTDETYESMQFLLNNSTADKVFTGINALIREGYFNTLEGVHAEHCSVLQNWAQGEPNNLNGNERCVSLNDIGYLADVDCDISLPFICYRKKTGEERLNFCGTIDNAYEYYSHTTSCYKIHTEARNFSESFMTCQAEGGYLAIVNSDLEAEIIKNLIIRHPPNSIKGNHDKNYYYLGFHDDWYKDRGFMTIQDQTLEGAGGRFGHGEPDYDRLEYCGSVYRGTTALQDIKCSGKCGFICEINPVALC